MFLPEKLPGWHSVQTLDPLAAEYVPGRQGMQLGDPGLLVMDPAGQISQAVEAFALENWPCSQGVQTLASEDDE